MPSCSRIRDFIINRDAGKWRAVLTLSLSPQDVDIPGIVTAAFPGSRIESISREWKMLETSYEAVIELPGSVRCLELRKLLSILRWTVTISDSADESHAIYLHNLPHPTEDPYEVVWKHTKVGKLVNRAKSYSAFSGSRKAALELADKVEYWLTRHIRYASADLIIPAPPGNPDKAFDLPRFVADEVGGRLGLPVGLCTATGLTQPQKGVEQEIPELYSNIDGKYRAQSSLKRHDSHRYGRPLSIRGNYERARSSMPCCWSHDGPVAHVHQDCQVRYRLDGE